MINWIKNHKFETHLTAFLLMVIPSVGLYFAANAGVTALIWGLLGVFAFGNLLAIVVK